MMPFITSTSTASDSTTKGCIKAERDALLAFKAQIIHHKAHPISSWGDQSDDCCHWAGVRCDNNTGHVVLLNLQPNRPQSFDGTCDKWDLSGNISESLIGLQHLTYLDLSNNCFLNISIPKFLGSLEYLVHLDLSYSYFTGIIPHELGNLTRLRYLNLANYYDRNKVDDAEWLSGLSSLRYLSMDGVNISGVDNVMQSLNKLRHLKHVSLDDCSMNSIPESLPHLNFTSLTFMDIGGNYMFDNTSIPEWLFRIPNLRELYMDFTGFTGAIPSSVGNATSLQFLDLSDNRGISGDMPRGFGGLCNLRRLYLGGTFVGKSLEEDFRDAFFGCIRRNLNELSFFAGSLQGPLPDWLGEFTNLTFLDLSYNYFNSSIPESIGNATSLQILDLSDNRGISGDMPRGFGDLCNLRRLYLDGTFIGKSLEENFRDAFSGCIRRNLNVFSFKFSSLQGPLLDWLGEFTNLTFLDLSYNSFNSSIPASIGRLLKLQQLHLYGNTLNGSIPASLGRLSGLQNLVLGGNDLNGPIPESLGRLSGLQNLNLGGNDLNGPIPESLGRLSGLQSLDLRGNNLNGPIPESLGRLSGLQSLDLRGNHLNGPIPESLGRLSGLQSLDLRGNHLNGPIPESLGRLSALLYLGLNGNDLNGPIPESLGQLSNLFRLDLSYNFNYYNSVITEAHLANLTSLKQLFLDHTNLVLNISTNWIPGFQLDGLSLSYCNVGPKFPVWLANQVNLVSLNISNTGIKDSIPDWFWNITYSISQLDLSNNEINGRLPHRFKFQAKDAVGIFLGSNHFEGSIPYFPFNVYALDLSNNSFSGIIPSSLCNLVDLVLLKLSNNHLEGTIPNCWNNLTSLQYLILANNSLAGEVPNSLISSSQSLQVLHLSNNQLHGEFPPFLKKCTSMTTLALDHNNFSGEIPSWVGEIMTSLMIMTLKENNFSGNLPLLSNLISLHFLDLSHNSFVGNIPQSYGNLMGMINVSMNGGASFSSHIDEVLVITITVSTKGLELQFGVTLSSLKFIDLSANNLSGQIPKEIVKLDGLQNLDLSCNNLSGEIPIDIGRMQSLESLDLSRNELIGSIPPGLSTLHFLESLNLSYNNLSGKIPYASQLTTFNDPSIYANNLNLCGAPLDKNCASDEPPSTSHDQENDDDEDGPPVWFYIGLMLGFVFGFWIVWGILLFKKTWRHIYFIFLDQTYDMMYVKIVVTIHRIKRALVAMKSM